MSIRSRLAALTAAALVTGGLAFAAALPASASIPQINNTHTGEAGYYVNDNGATRIRDVQATTVVQNTFKHLNGSGGELVQAGGIGVELCNDNTNFAAQLGIVWNDSTNAFQVEYGYGGLHDDPSVVIQDPCAQDGLLNGGALGSFTEPVTGIHGNVALFPHGIVPNVGDTLKFEIFYQPAGHFHYFQFKVNDVTQNRTEVQQVFAGWQNLYEAGIGVLTQANQLTGGPINLLNTFSGTSFNYYSSNHPFNSILVPAHWDLEQAQFINSSSQVTLSPNSSLNPQGTGFSLFEGSTSA